MTPDDTFHREFAHFAVSVVASTRAHRDVHPLRTERDLLDERQMHIAGRRWAMLDQQHGLDVVQVDTDSAWPVAGTGDVVVSRAGTPVGVWAADCAPVLLFGTSGAVVGVHGGWRGLADGVLDVGVDALVALGEGMACAVLGPVINPCCYEFGFEDLACVAAGVHASIDEVSGTTVTGSLALDVPAAVRAGLASRGVTLDVLGGCTGCDTHRFSHRVRTDAGRHVVVGWVDTFGDGDA